MHRAEVGEQDGTTRVRHVTLGERDFLLDGEPLRIVAGAMHYFRIHPDQWAERIAAARDFGLNAIDTYVAWNAHSRHPGEFRTDGGLDLGRYLDLVAEAGLFAIVRPGPYICAEWSNGGLPGWLTADESIALRSTDPAYLAAVEGYFGHVLPIVAARQVTRGGNVILVQVENEYGAYGDDPAYLDELARLTREAGIDVPLFTCDQANDEMLARGGRPHLLTAGTFGSRSPERLAALRRAQPTGPLLCAEYWDGWFDSWGQVHHTTDPAESAKDLDALLSAGASLSFYMFCGGTNLELGAGANDKGNYAGIVTSYDYDAPLTEDGRPGPKYHAFREVLARHGFVTPAPVNDADADPAPDAAPAPAFETPLRRGRSFDDVDWGQARPWDRLPTMDEVDPAAVIGVYDCLVEAGDDLVAFAEIRDRAHGFLDGRPIGGAHRSNHETTLPLGDIGDAGGRLRIIVEDLGRVDYGPRLGEAKGLIGPALTARRPLTAWSVTPIRHDEVCARDVWGGGAPLAGTDLVRGPVFLWSDIEAPAGRDLFLDVVGWGHGIAWMNGACLGRYSSVGPTQTLYVPGPLVRGGANRLLVLELVSCQRPTARFQPGPRLGHTEE